MVICLLFVGLFGVLWLRYKNYKKDIFDKLPKKGNELKVLYPIAYGLIIMLERHKITLSSSRRKKQLDSLNVVLETKESEIIFNVKRVSLALFVALLAAVLGLLYGLSENENKILQGNSVSRPGYGQAIVNYNLIANGNDLIFDINPREYSYEEVLENFAIAYEKLLNLMLADNSSLDAVESNLNLITTMDEYALKISWMSSDMDVIDIYGVVSNEYFGDKEAQNVVLTAVLSYMDYECTYEIDVTVIAPDLTNEEKLLRDIKKIIAENNKSNLQEEVVFLPENVSGQEIIYEEQQEDYTLVLFLLGLVTAIVILPGMDKDLDGKIKERNKQMMLDYSEVVSKLNILIGAGMSTLRAWEKIVRDYEKKLIKYPNNRRYVYEEMRITYHEIQSGISESNAYSNFGKRCNIHEYLKLGALLEQNVRKGTKGLGKMLENESMQAFEQRKNLAKKLGEEAGTKLLIPMIMMLAIVMVIVLIPAFTSFGV